MASTGERPDERAQRREQSAEACIHCTKQFKVFPGVHSSVHGSSWYVQACIQCSRQSKVLEAYFES